MRNKNGLERTTLRLITLILIGIFAAVLISSPDEALAKKPPTGKDHYPYSKLEDAYKAISFDPAAKGAAVFVVTADVHYGLNDGKGVQPMVEEMNAMKVRPAFFAIAGDMAVTCSRSFGRVPNKSERKKAIAEFKALKEHLDKLHPSIKTKLVLGNHDQAPGRGEKELFGAVFPDHPTYSSFDVAGVHFVALNGHGDGWIDKKQMDWFKADVAKLSPESTIVTLVHQPALGSVVNERGIAIAVSEAFADWAGPLWLIAGHHHHNRTTVYKLPKTTIVQAAISSGGSGFWGGPESPGYWVYCLKDGKVVARIYRKLAMGFRTEPKVGAKKVRTLPLPWEGVDGVKWKVFAGDDDKQYYVEGQARDCTTWWYNVKNLTYRLPLNKADGAGHVGILAAIPSKAMAAQKFFLSSDGKNWTQITKIDQPVRNHYLLKIPAEMRKGKDIYVKYVSPGRTTVAGYALLK